MRKEIPKWLTNVVSEPRTNSEIKAQGENLTVVQDSRLENEQTRILKEQWEKFRANQIVEDLGIFFSNYTLFQSNPKWEIGDLTIQPADLYVKSWYISKNLSYDYPRTESYAHKDDGGPSSMGGGFYELLEFGLSIRDGFFARYRPYNLGRYIHVLGRPEKIKNPEELQKLVSSYVTEQLKYEKIRDAHHDR